LVRGEDDVLGKHKGLIVEVMKAHAPLDGLGQRVVSFDLFRGATHGHLRKDWVRQL
jgi:hypothetical protein